MANLVDQLLDIVPTGSTALRVRIIIAPSAPMRPAATAVTMAR